MNNHALPVLWRPDFLENHMSIENQITTSAIILNKSAFSLTNHIFNDPIMISGGNLLDGKKVVVCLLK